MKILFIVPGLRKNGGGVSEAVPNSCRALLKAGHEVGIAVCEPDSVSDSVEAAEREGVKIYRFSGNVGWRNPILFSWGMFWGLGRIVSDYDVIHLCANWLFPIWWGAHLARKLGKPYVIQPHGSFAPERLRISSWKKKPIGFLFEKRVVRGAKIAIATCEEEAEGIRRYVPGTKTVIIPNGLDVSLYVTKGVRRLDSESRERKLLFFSRISAVKGLELLAEAWSRLCATFSPLHHSTSQNWKLLIVGPDDRGYRAEIKKVFAAKCPQGSYEFCGPLYGEDKIKLLASVDAFVLPTRNENWGIAVAEAMASGLPVICTKGAPWACLEAEHAGRWVDITVDAIQQGLADVLSKTDEERLEMGLRGRKWVEDHIAWPTVAAQMVNAYPT